MQFRWTGSTVNGHILDDHLADDRASDKLDGSKQEEVILEAEQRDVRDGVVPERGHGAESKEEGEEPSVSRVRVREGDARNHPRRRSRELRTNEYETGELGGEEEVEVAGAGGEDPVAVPPGRDKHRRRPRDGRGGEGRIESGNTEALPRVVAAAAPAPVRIGGVAEERVGEGEGDEAVRRDAPKALQLRAHRHRELVTDGGGAAQGTGAQPTRAIPSRGFLLGDEEICNGGERGGDLMKESVKRKRTLRQAAGVGPMALAAARLGRGGGCWRPKPLPPAA